MTTKIPPIILHMGAHKTGTTSFQLWLKDNSTFLRKRGIINIVDVGLIRCAMGGKPMTTTQKEAVGLRSVITSAANEADVQRVIISFEGLLGNAISLGKSGLYPQRAIVLDHMVQALEDLPIEIAYTIRRQSALIESYFLQLLKQGVVTTFEQLTGSLIPDSYSWQPVIRDLERIGKVTIFPYEATTDPINVRLAKRYAGVSPSPAEFKSSNVTYSERAMEIAVRVLPLLKTGQEKAALRNFLVTRFCGADERRPVLLGDKLRAELDEIYREDVSKLLAT